MQRESVTMVSRRIEYPHMAKMYRLHGHYTGFLREVDAHFAECILGRAEPIIEARDGLYNIRILDAVLRSASTGKPVTL